MTHAGLFVTFEGTDGCGKSTQIRNLNKWLQNEYQIQPIVTAEPGGTPLGQYLREAHLDVRFTPIPYAELLILFAARAQHVGELIIPALESGKVVLCDRFTDSSRAYQGTGRGIPYEFIEQLQRNFVGIEPDITYFLDVDSETGLKRKRGVQKLDRLDRESLAFRERVRRGYLDLWNKNLQRIHLVDANPEEASVFETLKGSIEKYLEANPERLAMLKRTTADPAHSRYLSEIA